MNSFTGNSFFSFQCLCMIFLGAIRSLATHLRSFLRIPLKSEVSECIMTKLNFFFPSFSLFFHEGCCFIPESFNLLVLYEHMLRVTVDIPGQGFVLLAEETVKCPQEVSWAKSVGPLKLVGLVTLVISGLRSLGKILDLYQPGSSGSLFPLF